MLRGAGLIAAGVLWVALSGIAAAVTATGSPVRVDVDPHTSWYGFFGYQVIATQTGGFAVAWEQDTVQDRPFFPAIEGLKARIFRNTFVPVGAPKAPNTSGHIAPSLNGFFPIGTDKLFLAFGSTRRISGSETRREYFGQTLTITTEAIGARQLLNTTSNSGAATGRSAGLFDGRGIFGWFDGLVSASSPSVILGRFIAPTGSPQAANLRLTLSPGFAIADVRPLGPGFLALYRRIDGGSTQVSGRVFKANGTPLGAAHVLSPGVNNLPLLATFADGRILVATWIVSGSQVDLVGQIYSQTWSPIGSAKTLIEDGAANDRVDLAALPDGGIVLARSFGAFPTYKHTVQRFSSTLTAVGAVYTIPSVGLDFARIAALSATKAVLVFKQNLGGRSRLVAQALRL